MAVSKTGPAGVLVPDRDLACDEDVLSGEVVLRKQHCQGPGQGLVVVVGHCCVYVSVTCRQCCIHNFEDVLMNGSQL